MALATGCEGLVEAQKQLQLGASAGQDESASMGRRWAIHQGEGQSGLLHYEATGLVSGRWVGLQLP